MNPVRYGKTIGFPEIAARTGKTLTSIPMKDKSTIKILSDERSFNVFQVKNGKIIDAWGMFGSKASTDKVDNFASVMLERIQKNAAEVIDVMREWMKSLANQVSKQNF